MNTFSSSLTIFAIVFFVLLVSCEQSENISPDKVAVSHALKNDNGKGDVKGKGKGHSNNDDDGSNGGTEPPGPMTTYQLEQSVDFDPLYKFSLNLDETKILLETDPTITTWGTDYWGSWSDPFPYSNNSLNYINGLTNVTYEFTYLPGNRVDVNKILIVSPYPSGNPTTTITNPGIYKLVE